MLAIKQDSSTTVSVAMGTYNGGRFLLELLSSVATQTLLPIELVICDDGSTDTTAQIVTDFKRSVPFEVRFVQNSSRLGIAKNYEKAIRLCRGKFIALVDQDDAWNPDKLNRCIEVLERNSDLGGVFSDAELMDEHSALLGRRLWSGVPFRPRKDRYNSLEFMRLLLKQNVATSPTIVFRSELRETIVPIPAAWMQDAWIVWMIVLYSSLGFIREPLVRYRIHSAQEMGLASTSLRDRFRMAHRARNLAYIELAQRFGNLREKLLEHPSPEQVSYLRELDRRIQLFHLQSKLPSNRIMRAAQIISAFPSYIRYTRGLVTICRDLLV